LIPTLHILGTVTRTEQFSFGNGHGCKLFLEVMARRNTRDGGSYDEPLMYEIAAYGDNRIGEMMNLQPGSHRSIHCELRSKHGNQGRWFINLVFLGLSPNQPQESQAPTYGAQPQQAYAPQPQPAQQQPVPQQPQPQPQQTQPAPQQTPLTQSEIDEVPF